MNLRHLLKRDSQRQLQLIETLYYSPNPRSSEELSKITKCTTPALLNDIRSINTQSDYYQIIRENSLYRLELADNATIDVLFSTLINQSMAFKILEAIFFEDCSTLQELSRKLFCSLTTVQSAMKDLQEALGQWKMTVERRPFRLTGNEIAIRHLFFLYFSEKKFVREQTRYSTEFYQFGDAIVRSMITENELPVSIAQYNRLNLNFFISLIRISKGHRITSRNLTSKSIEAPNQHAINNFSPYLRRELRLIYSEDIMKDSFWLLYADLFLLSEKQKQKSLSTNFSLAYHYETHYEFAETLSKRLIEPLSEQQKDELATILINQHLFHAKTKEFISVIQDRKRDCLQLMEAFHAHWVYQLRQLVVDFTEQYQLFNTPEFIDNYIYQIIATIPRCMDGMKQSEKPIDISIISTDSKMQEALLTEFIKFSIRGNYRLQQIGIDEIQGDNLLPVFNQSDIVVSTSTFDVPNCQTPIIAVELCPSIQSLNKIQNLIDQLQRERSQKFIETNKNTVE